MKPYRSCSCRDPSTGRPFPTRKPENDDDDKRCPRLVKSSSHGAWYARFEAPAGPGSKRRQPRLGPFATQKEAKDALTVALGQVEAGTLAADHKLTVGAYLGRWLEDMRPGLKPRTWASYEEAVRLYYRPGIGHVRLADLRDHHIRALYAAMRKINRSEAEDSGDEMLRRLLAARRTIPTCRASCGGPRRSERPASNGVMRSSPRPWTTQSSAA